MPASRYFFTLRSPCMNKVSSVFNFFHATQKEVSKPEDNDYWQRQAEVLIKGFIPVKYIVNVNSPEILD